MPQNVHQWLTDQIQGPKQEMQRSVQMVALHPAVIGLFGRAMELKIPRNYFAAWMIAPLPALHGARPCMR